MTPQREALVMYREIIQEIRAHVEADRTPIREVSQNLGFADTTLEKYLYHQSRAMMSCHKLFTLLAHYNLELYLTKELDNDTPNETE